MATKKVKQEAQYVCGTKQEVMDAIKSIGDLQRESIKKTAKMNDLIAEIANQYARPLDEIKAKVGELTYAVEHWCNANKDELCRDGEKTINFITGLVSWRSNPAGVEVKGEEYVIEELEKRGMWNMVRISKSVDRNAIKSCPEAVVDIRGIKIKQKPDTFSIEPFAAEV